VVHSALRDFQTIKKVLLPLLCVRTSSLDWHLSAYSRQLWLFIIEQTISSSLSRCLPFPLKTPLSMRLHHLAVLYSVHLPRCLSIVV